MPVDFPRLDADTGELVQVKHYTVDEVAAMLHASSNTVRRHCYDDSWPHVRIARHTYMTAEHVERIMELHTVDPDELPELPTRLGIVTDPSELEGLR
jgi:hypothetical protein